MRILKFPLIVLYLGTFLSESFGEEALANLSFSASEVTIAPGRELLFAVNPLEKSLVVVNLKAQGTSSLPLSMIPVGMALTRDEKWLYVSEVTSFPPISSPPPGKVARINLDLMSVDEEIELDFTPFNFVATKASQLIMIGSGNGTVKGRVVDGLAGEIKSTFTIEQNSPLTLDPGETSVFGMSLGRKAGWLSRGLFDTNTGAFTGFRQIRYVDDKGSAAGIVIEGAGKQMITTPFGFLYSLSDIATDDMVYRGRLNTADRMLCLEFDPKHQSIIGATETQLVFFRADSLDQFRSLPLSHPGARTILVGETNVIVAGITSIETWAARLPNIAEGLESDGPPTAVFSWAPVEPATTDDVILDASGSSDETPDGGLTYRWDFNNDGIFDTPVLTESKLRHQFQTDGTNTVLLEVRDTFGGVSVAKHEIVAHQVPDAGWVPVPGIPFVIDFTVTAAAFDPLRPYLYITKDSSNLVMRLNLTNGVQERAWTVNGAPGVMSVTPDGDRLYVAMSSTQAPQSVRLVAFDLETQTKIHEMILDSAPIDILAASRDFVITSGNILLRVFDTRIGKTVSTAPTEEGGLLTLHPSRKALYGSPLGHGTLERYDFDETTGKILRRTSSSMIMGAGVFPVASGTAVITSQGALLTSSLNSSQDLKFIQNLPTGLPLKRAVDIPAKHLAAILVDDRLDYYNTDTWKSFLILKSSIWSEFLGTYQGHLYEVAVTKTNTVVKAHLLPAVSVEENNAPAFQSIEPHEATVLTLGDTLNLSAEASDDDGLITSLQFFDGTNSLTSLVTPPFNFAWKPSEAGIHLLKGVATDNLGAITESASIQVLVNVPPAVSFLDPSPLPPFNSPADFTLRVQASDVDGELNSLDFYYSAPRLPIKFLGRISQSPFELAMHDFVGQGGTFTVVATDNLGATNSATAMYTLAGLMGDDFSRPYLLEGTNAIAYANNSLATREGLETPINDHDIPNTIWWTWTAPDSGVATISTRGSSFDTVVGVFEGTRVNNLRITTWSDDDPEYPLTSRAKWAAKKGVVYHISVGGSVSIHRGTTQILGQLEEGDIRLELSFKPIVSVQGTPAPPNDNFINAEFLTGATAQDEGSNDGATREVGEPVTLGFSEKTVWWKWTAPKNGIVSATTAGSDFDTTLGVYSGAAVNALKLVAANDDLAGTASTVSFSAVEGVTYSFSVDGFGGESGKIKLNLTLMDAETGPPANDAFNQRTILAGPIVIAEGRTTFATSEPGEPKVSANSAGHTVWWSWSSPAEANVYISGRSATSNANDYHNIPFVIFTGDNLKNLQLVQAAQIIATAGGAKGVARFRAEAGKTYQILFDAEAQDVARIVLLIDATLMTYPFVLHAPQLISGDKFQMKLASLYPRLVHLQRSSDLRTWNTIISTNIDGSTLIDVDVESPANFFRAVGF
jgi:hypothetical protein